MFNLDEEKIEWSLLGNKEFCFGRARKLSMLCFYFWRWDSRHLFVTAKSKQLDWSCSLTREKKIDLYEHYYKSVIGDYKICVPTPA